MDDLTIKERFFLAYKLKDELLKVTPWDKRNEVEKKTTVTKFRNTATLNTDIAGWVLIKPDGTLDEYIFTDGREKIPQLDDAFSSYNKNLDGYLRFLESKRENPDPPPKPAAPRSVNVHKYFNKVYTDVKETYKELKKDAGEFETGTPKQKKYAEKIRDNILTGFAIYLTDFHSDSNENFIRDAKKFLFGHQKDLVNALGIRDAAAFLNIYAGSPFADNPYGDIRMKNVRLKTKRYYYY